jgi:hypothetical protein
MASLNLRIARRNLLQVGVRGAKSPCHRTAVIAAELVKFRMDTTVVLVT